VQLVAFMIKKYTLIVINASKYAYFWKKHVCVMPEIFLCYPQRSLKLTRGMFQKSTYIHPHPSNL